MKDTESPWSEIEKELSDLENFQDDVQTVQEKYRKRLRIAIDYTHALAEALLHKTIVRYIAGSTDEQEDYS